MKRWLSALWERRNGTAVARALEAEFQRDFPDRCLICAYHRYGVTHCLTREPRPALHLCREAPPCREAKP